MPHTPVYMNDSTEKLERKMIDGNVTGVDKETDTVTTFVTIKGDNGKEYRSTLLRFDKTLYIASYIKIGDRVTGQIVDGRFKILKVKKGCAVHLVSMILIGIFLLW